MICALLLLFAPLVLCILYFFFQRKFLVPSPTAADVAAIVRNVDEREVDDLLNEPKEAIFRANSNAAQFKEGQRTRARVLFEYLRRMAFNASVLLSWAYAERKNLARPGMPDDETIAQAIGEIIDAGTAFRAYIVVALPRLSSRILLNGITFRSAGSLTKSRHIAGINGLEQYRRLTGASVALSVALASDATRRLMALLHESDLDSRF